MERHITILGVLHIANSALSLLAAFVVFIIFIAVGTIPRLHHDEAVGLLVIGTILAIILFFVSIPGIIGGIGLLKRKNWARILVLVVGIINLPGIPFGTALGIYTLWVLLREETTKLFNGA